MKKILPAIHVIEKTYKTFACDCMSDLSRERDSLKPGSFVEM